MGDLPKIRRTDSDRCPGVLALHEAEDGWLARIRLPGGRISAGQLEAVAAAAGLGSGLVELTARGNLQVRGLPAAAGAELTGLLADAELLPSADHDRARNIIASPLAGRHPRSLLETDGIVRELDRRLCADPALAALPGRFLFCVDDGSGLALGRGADLEIRAVSTAAGPAFTLAVAGTATTPTVPPSAAAATALRAARAFLELRTARGGGAWRLRELAGGAEEVARRIGALPRPAAAPPQPVADRGRAAIAPGRSEQSDGRVAVTALPPLGRLHRDALRELAALAGACGGDLRLSPWRTVTVVDVPRGRAQALAKELGERLGLAVSEASGWAGLSSCAGHGFCAKARADVREAAERRGRIRDGDSPAEHWSACERRCGEPADARIAVAAVRQGLAVRIGEREREVADAAEALQAVSAEARGG